MELLGLELLSLGVSERVTVEPSEQPPNDRYPSQVIRDGVAVHLEVVNVVVSDPDDDVVLALEFSLSLNVAAVVGVAVDELHEHPSEDRMALRIGVVESVDMRLDVGLVVDFGRRDVEFRPPSQGFRQACE